MTKKKHFQRKVAEHRNYKYVGVVPPSLLGLNTLKIVTTNLVHSLLTSTFSSNQIFKTVLEMSNYFVVDSYIVISSAK